MLLTSEVHDRRILLITACAIVKTVFLRVNVVNAYENNEEAAENEQNKRRKKLEEASRDSEATIVRAI